jgi:hypothetical protein
MIFFAQGKGSCTCPIDKSISTVTSIRTLFTRPEISICRSRDRHLRFVTSYSLLVASKARSSGKLLFSYSLLIIVTCSSRTLRAHGGQRAANTNDASAAPSCSSFGAAPTRHNHYASNVWMHSCGSAAMASINRVQRIGAHAITGAFRTVATAIGEAEASIRTVRVRHAERAIKLCVSLRTLPQTNPLSRLGTRVFQRFTSPL